MIDDHNRLTWYTSCTRGRRGPVLPSFHPARNKVQQRAMNWILARIFWVWDNTGEETVLLLDTIPLNLFVGHVTAEVGVASIPITDLEMDWRGFRTTEWIEPPVGECEGSKGRSLCKENVSSSISSALGRIIKPIVWRLKWVLEFYVVLCWSPTGCISRIFIREKADNKFLKMSSVVKQRHWQPRRQWSGEYGKDMFSSYRIQQRTQGAVITESRPLPLREVVKSRLGIPTVD